MSEPNITLLTRTYHGFLGVKVSFSRSGESFVCYFSEPEYGGAEAAMKAAEEVRDATACALAGTSAPLRNLFLYRIPAPDLPPGMHPLQKKPKIPACASTLAAPPSPQACALRRGRASLLGASGNLGIEAPQGAPNGGAGEVLLHPSAPCCSQPSAFPGILRQLLHGLLQRVGIIRGHKDARFGIHRVIAATDVVCDAGQGRSRRFEQGIPFALGVDNSGEQASQTVGRFEDKAQQTASPRENQPRERVDAYGNANKEGGGHAQHPRLWIYQESLIIYDE